LRSRIFDSRVRISPDAIAEIFLIAYLTKIGKWQTANRFSLGIAPELVMEMYVIPIGASLPLVRASDDFFKALIAAERVRRATTLARRS